MMHNKKEISDVVSQILFRLTRDEELSVERSTDKRISTIKISSNTASINGKQTEHIMIHVNGRKITISAYVVHGSSGFPSAMVNNIKVSTPRALADRLKSLRRVIEFKSALKPTI